VNLLLFDAADRLDEAYIAVRGRRLQHLRQVIGAAPGQQLRVGELGGLVGRGEIESVDAQRAVLSVVLDTPPPPKLPLRLVLALPRPKMLRRILRAVAEFGVQDLHLINSYRVEKSFWQTPVLSDDTLRDCLQQGLEQARDTVLPAVHRHRLFRPFVEDVLPGLCAGRRALLAHPGDPPPCPVGCPGDSLVVVGPEGGFIPYEVEQLAAAGCVAVSLGPRILRVEHALVALLGRLSY
jgi:RsmE family RNA methyltransferase